MCGFGNTILCHLIQVVRARATGSPVRSNTQMLVSKIELKSQDLKNDKNRHSFPSSNHLQHHVQAPRPPPAKSMYGGSNVRTGYSHVGNQDGPRQARKRPMQPPENPQSHHPIFRGPPNKKVRVPDNHASFDGLPRTYMHEEKFCYLLFPLKNLISVDA